MDFVTPKEEEQKAGMESEEEEEEGEKEYDEHIWTSIPNAIRLVNAIRDKITSLDMGKQEQYSKNAETYTARLSEIDTKLRSIATQKNDRTLIFGDRFPFRYFVDEYGLDYYAAFPGCSDQTEASANTVAFLTEKAKELGVKAIFKIEMSSDKLAQTIAEEVGARVYTLHAAHNISEDEFASGLSYAEIMEQNAKTLTEALN
jgi:zinc transport system substrate-binding protein